MFCSYCGQQLIEDAQFCINCGNKIPRTEPKIKSNKPRIDKQKFALVQPISKHAKRLRLKILLAFILLLGIGFWGYYYHRYQILPQSLYQESLEFAESGHYSKAITNLEKAISLKANEKFITLLITLQTEKETVDLINVFYESLTETRELARRASTLTELNQLCTSLFPFVEKIDALSLEWNSEVANFVHNLEENAMYQLFAEEYATGNTLSDLSSTSTLNSELILNSAKALVNYALDERLWIKRPDCFKTIN